VNILLFVLEIFGILAGIALVPKQSELRSRRSFGIHDEHHSKRVAREWRNP
jgi:hypothetical protein